MEIGICGYGIVGEAIGEYFKNRIIYDKYKKIGDLNDLLRCNIIYLALPTNENKGSYDMSEIEEICEKLKEKNYKGNIILKSTVEPNTTEYLSEKYDLSISHNPEFLSEKTAINDYKNQDHIVIGFTMKSKKELIQDFFIKSFPNCKNFTFCTSKESELMKLVVNGFYATKIQYFTEIFLLCNHYSINYETIREMILKNGWINPMHTVIPGHDNKLSYGGKCLPKDISVLNNILKNNNIPHGVIDIVINENKLLRQ